MHKNPLKMKKILLTICLAAASTICALAQTTVRGTVVDGSGNPIPGALVEVVGDNQSVITELDGSFAITTPSKSSRLRASYAGMTSKTKTASQGMRIKLASQGWINEAPEKYNWIVTLQGAFPESGFQRPSLGVMVGRVKDIGWYVKGVYRPVKSTHGTYFKGDSNGNPASWIPADGSDTKHSYWAATAGAIVRVKGPFHLYVGGGYVNRKIAIELADGSYTKDADQSYDGATLDYGLMFNMKHIVVTAGAMNNLSGDCHFTGCIGVGYSF